MILLETNKKPRRRNKSNPNTIAKKFQQFTHNYYILNDV